MSIPKNAFQLTSDVNPEVVFAENAPDAPKMNILGYSGKAIKDHWYWGDLVIDLDGMSFNKKQYPVLENHDTDRKIGFSKKPVIENGELRLNPDTTNFVSTEYADNFIKLSQEGFPYQASISAQPTKVLNIEEGETFEANGHKFKGPASVWAKSEYREVSVCTFGYDDRTSSSTFAKDFEGVKSVTISDAEVFVDYKDADSAESQTKTINGGKEMDLKTLQEKHPELVAQIAKDAVDMAKQEAGQVLDAAKTEFAKEKTEFTEALKASTQRIAQLEKAEAIRAEQAVQFAAKGIWDSALAGSAIADHLHVKVRKMVTHSSFMKEGVFDVEAFTAAVDAEIKDWSKLEADSQVLGAGFIQKETGVTNDTFAKENSDALSLLKKLSGQE